MSIRYRPEIDGLRAVAMLSVLVYHLKISLGGEVLFKGGFLGVDIFFVISGFLITRILIAEFERERRVSLAGFYLRRVRRIMPPLLLVMICSLPVAFFLLLPSEIERFAQSLMAALLFFSNFFWFFELKEYGAQSGLLQPFLHTWSLSIEEQFYLFFPAFMALVLPRMSRRGLLSVLVALFVVSLALSVATTQVRADFSFFSPVSRAWELLAGAIMAMIPARQQDGRESVARIVQPLALVFLVGCMLTFDLAGLAHPGLPTVPVVLATCALIYCAGPGLIVTRLLSSGPMVWVGRLSYSLYLWHFPIFAFGRLSSVETPGAADMALWIALTFALSWIGYHIVETPFRRTLGSRAFALSMTGAVALVAGFYGLSERTTLLTQGRAAELAEIYGPNDFDNERLRDVSWTPLAQLAGGEEIGAWNAHEPSRNEATQLWFGDDARRNVLVVGNSHSKDMFNALYLNRALFPGYEFARFGLDGRFPAEQMQELTDAPNYKAADIILLAPRYNTEFETLLPPVIERMKADGKEVIVVGNTVEFISPGEQPIFDWYMLQYHGKGDLDRANEIAFGAQATQVRDRNARLRDLAGALGVTYLSRHDLICEDAAKTCAIATPEGMKTMYDYGHWTIEGAQHFGRVAAERNWLPVN